MKIKIKVSLLIVFITMLVLVNEVFGATFSISSSRTTLNIGETAVITVNGGSVTGGPLTIVSSNPSVVSTTALGNGAWVENNSISATCTAKAEGTATITVSGTVANSSNSNDESYVIKTVTITVTKPAPAATPPSTPTQPNNSNTNTNTNTTNNKSSNAYLKSLILDVEGMNPAFAKNITSYSINVPESVNKINVTASTEHNRATYSLYGNDNLKVGENVISVKVAAENGTTRTYNISVLKSDTPEESRATLSNLIIEDADLDKDFDPNITEYNIGDISIKDKKLNIFAYATNDKAKIEILGNDNLGTGEHVITIKVTSENGEVTKDYTIKFNKLVSDDEDVNIYEELGYKNTQGNSFWDNLKNLYNNVLKENMTIILLYFFVWFEFLQVVYLYEKLKKEDKKEAVNKLMNEAIEIDDKKGKARRVVAREEAEKQEETKNEQEKDVVEELEEDTKQEDVDDSKKQ